MKKILVPTDFSKNAYRAMDYALQLAKKVEADIHVFHVIFPNQDLYASGDYSMWVDEYISQRKIDTNQWALNFKKKAKYAHINITSDAQMGFPVSLIIQTAEKENFDLIVMGTTGSTGILSNILGSVAAGVIGHTSVPILTIPPNAKFRVSRPFVFATDFRASLDYHSLDTLKTLTGLRRPKVRILHVRKKSSTKPTEQEEQKFRDKIGDLNSEFHYLTDSNVESAVGNFIEATDAGGLITVSHDHTLLYKLFHDSISKNLAGHIQVPVLVIQDAKIEKAVVA